MIRFTWLKSALLLLAAALLAVPLSASAGLGWDSARRDDDVTRGELLRFDTFLDAHPQIDRELRADPRLVDNRQYVASHPELGEFLKSHPGVREEIRENPRAFMKREGKFEKGEAKGAKRERKEAKRERKEERKEQRWRDRR